jgi:hypothetical protein
MGGAFIAMSAADAWPVNPATVVKASNNFFIEAPTEKMNCLKTDPTIGMILRHCCDALVTVASKAGSNSSAHADGFGAASGGVRDLPLTVAGLALDGIDSTAWLRRLLHGWVARSIAVGARVLFDLWRHA